MVPNLPSRDEPQPREKGSDRPKTVSTAQLFGQFREIAIDHEGTIYRLRITRQGKLILNK
ncbi:hemin uptake protein HemP [Pelagibacterium sp. 26DY04]|uniref:hemin uptake protein HemP n=1 Tax=unclassified Pelagibacterium TaxID=2623280 RepID=UPI00281545F4|nr:MULTISPECIES: hemin uptake protein HemP [unclassified Pelagibacterium]WMT88818.1 hemin uptake protein HemP [Pelagibacterium sp. 26DY04]WMT91556.1 hemin uptake protein HemP [Pelagibacterium sp. H642]